MAIAVLCVGAFLTLLGIVGYLYGLDLLPNERGVAGVIAASVAVAGGVITIALGLVLKRMDELMKLLPAARVGLPAPVEPAAAPAAAATVDEAPAPIELPKIVPVERPRVAEDAPPVRPNLPLSKGPAIAAGAAVAGTTVAATAAHEAIEKALEFDLSQESQQAVPKLPKVVPLEPRPVRSDPLDIPAIDLPDFDLPKVDLPKVDLPKAEPPKVEMPKIDLPKIELPKIDLPKIDLPKVDLPKTDRAKTDRPKFEFPKLDLPKREPAKAAEPAAPRDDAGGSAKRDHEVEFPVEVLEPVEEPAPVAVKPVAPAAKVADVIEDFERELAPLSVLKNEKAPAPAAKAPKPPVSETVADKAPAPSVAEPAKEPQPEKTVAEVLAEDAPKAADPAPQIKPAEQGKPAPGAEVVGAYESGGAKYTMYSDGSVVAEAGGETLFFKSLEELRDFIDAGVKT